MATTQPTPQPPNPTTDSEETPPTTNQQTQEPVGPFEGATGTELRVPTTSETATDLPILNSRSGPTNIGLIIGILVIIVIVTVSVVTVVVIIAILLKKRNKKSTAITVPTAASQTYGRPQHT